MLRTVAVRSAILQSIESSIANQINAETLNKRREKDTVILIIIAIIIKKDLSYRVFKFSVFAG